MFGGWEPEVKVRCIHGGVTYSGHQNRRGPLPPLPPLWGGWRLHHPPTDHHVTDPRSPPVWPPVQSSPLMTKACPHQTSRSRLAFRDRKHELGQKRPEGILDYSGQSDYGWWFLTCSPAAADWAWSSREKRPSSITVLVRCSLDTAREYIISSTVSLARRRTTFTGL